MIEGMRAVQVFPATGHLHRCLWLVCAMMCAVAVPASAHRGSVAPGSTAGLSIPSVSHGQMVVLANNRAAILKLADQQYPTDSEMRRLQTYVSLQFFAWAWGLMPGGLRDETSPFNECTHAYLAGVRALLLHLRVMPGDRAAVRALSKKIDLEMLNNHASMMLCRFSEEPFNTADIVFPRWSDVATDGPSLMTLGALALVAAAGGWSAVRLKNSRVSERTLVS